MNEPEPTVSPRRGRPSKGVLFVLLAIAAVLVVAHGIGRGSDQAGLVDVGWIDPVRTAEGMSGEAMALASREDFSSAVRLARNAVTRLPISQPAVRTLGEVALLREGSESWSNAEMLVAGRLGWRDRQTQARLMMVAAQDGDLGGAIDRIDAIFRRTEIGEELFNAVAAGLSDETVRGAVARRIADDPPWRAAYLESAGRFGTKDSTANFAALLADVQSLEGSPLERREVDPLLSRLAALEMDTELARYAGVLGPYAASGGLLNDADFARFGREGQSDGGAGEGPFDWRKGRAQGTVVSTRSGDNGRELSVRTRSRVQGVALVQSLRLEPGSYRLAYEQQAGKGFSWRLTCGGDTVATDEASASSDRDWSESGFSFAVPDGCPIQRLELVTGRNLGGDTRRGAWRDLSIRRAGQS